MKHPKKPNAGSPPESDAAGRQADGDVADDIDASATDFAPEPDPADDDAPGAGPVVADSDVRRELSAERDKYLRLAAEYDNYRKRTARERGGARRAAHRPISPSTCSTPSTTSVDSPTWIRPRSTR